MLIRLTANAAIHAAAGLAMAGLAVAAAEGWRRANAKDRETANDPLGMAPPPAPEPESDAGGKPDG